MALFDLTSREAQAVREGLVHTGITRLGAAGAAYSNMPTDVMASTTKSADQIVAAMRDRFWKKEFDQFKELYMKPAMQDLTRAQQQWQSKTAIAQRTIVRPANATEVAQEAAAESPPAPKGPAGEKPTGAAISPPGTGVVEARQAMSIMDPNTGEPIPLGESSSPIEIMQQAMNEFLLAYQDITINLMNVGAEFPNNPYINQAMEGVISNLTRQLGYSATGVQDIQGQEEKWLGMRETEARIEESYLTGQKQREALTRARAEDQAVIGEALNYMRNPDYAQYYVGIDVKNLAARKPETMMQVRAITENIRTLESEKRTAVRAGMRAVRIVPEVAIDSPETYPLYVEQSPEYKTARARIRSSRIAQLENELASGKLQMGQEWKDAIEAAPGDESEITAEFLNAEANRRWPEDHDLAMAEAFVQAVNVDPELHRRLRQDVEETRSYLISVGRWTQENEEAYKKGPEYSYIYGKFGVKWDPRRKFNHVGYVDKIIDERTGEVIRVPNYNFTPYEEYIPTGLGVKVKEEVIKEIEEEPSIRKKVRVTGKYEPTIKKEDVSKTTQKTDSIKKLIPPSERPRPKPWGQSALFQKGPEAEKARKAFKRVVRPPPGSPAEFLFKR